MPEDYDFNKELNNPNKSCSTETSSDAISSTSLPQRGSKGRPALHPSKKSRDFKIYALGSLNPTIIVYQSRTTSLPTMPLLSVTQPEIYSSSRDDKVVAAIPLLDADDKITGVDFGDEQPTIALTPAETLTGVSFKGSVVTESLVPVVTTLDDLQAPKDSEDVIDPDESTPRFAEDHSTVDPLAADSSEAEKQEMSLAELISTSSVSDDDSVGAYVVTQAELERQIFESSSVAINSAKTLGDTHGDIYNNLTGLRKLEIIKIFETEFLEFKDTVTSLRQQMSAGAVLTATGAIAVMAIIDKAVEPDPSKGPICVRHTGDQECDRGLHDGLNILFVKFLKQQRNIHPRILFSNHGDSFLKYAREFIKAGYTIPRHWAAWDGAYKASLISFIRLCESIEQENNGIDAAGLSGDKSFFRDLLEYYLKDVYSKVYLLDYSELADDQLVIYSHAPICHSIIFDAYRILVKPTIFNSDELFTDKEKLKTAIREINAKFKELLQRHIEGIFSDEPGKQFDLHEYLNRPENVSLLAIIWRRLSWPEQSVSITRKYHSDTSFPDFVYRNVHGHDSPLPVNLHGGYVTPKHVGEPLYFGQKSYCINAEYFTAAPEAMGDAGHCNSFDPVAAERSIEEKKQIPDLGVAPWLQGLYSSIALPDSVSTVRQLLSFGSRTRWRPVAAANKCIQHSHHELTAKVARDPRSQEFADSSDPEQTGLAKTLSEQSPRVCSARA